MNAYFIYTAHCASPYPMRSRGHRERGRRRHGARRAGGGWRMLPYAALRSRTRFFRAAMSIAKRIWPAILIDSKFSTKLHGTGLSPIFSDWKERFLLKRLYAHTGPWVLNLVRFSDCLLPALPTAAYTGTALKHFSETKLSAVYSVLTY